MAAYGRAGLAYCQKPKLNIFRFSLNSYNTVIPAFNINSCSIIHQSETCFGSDIEIFKSIDIYFTITLCEYAIIMSSDIDISRCSYICRIIADNALICPFISYKIRKYSNIFCRNIGVSDR